MPEPPLRVLLVDDEAPARRRLRDLLDDCGAALPITVVGEAQHGREALDLLQSAPADLVLTDIHMPDMDGIELARHLLKLAHPPVVIFTTAFHEHAVQAFEVNAIDYLMKPVRVQRLLGALQKVPRLKPVTAEKLSQLPASARRFLSVTERSRVVLVPLDDIVYLKAELKYITIRTAQREYLLEESLTKLESEFGIALRARAPQLPRRARLHPRLRAPRQRRRRLALGSAADRRDRRRCRSRAASNSWCATWAAKPRPEFGQQVTDVQRRNDVESRDADVVGAGTAILRRRCQLRASPPRRLPCAHSICGSLAYDTIMVFPDHFSRHILPEQTHVLSVSFQIGEMRREWGGCAGNIAYNLQHIGGEPVVMATIGDDGVDYRERLAALGIGVDGVRHVPGTYTAQAFIITDLDDNQITAFHPGAMNYSHQSRVSDVAGHRARHRRARRQGRHALARRAVRAGGHSVHLRSGPGHAAVRRTRAARDDRQGALRRRQRLRRPHAVRAHRRAARRRSPSGSRR